MSKGNGSNGREDLDREGYRESLLGKLSGTPDFPAESAGCADLEDGHRTGGKPRQGDEAGEPCVELVAKVDLPTRYGEFTLYGFYDAADDLEHTALVRGDVAGKDDVPVRVHSECHTGDVFGSLRCDCRDQLEASLDYVAKEDFGAIIYLRQEGRGIGLLNKLKAYRLQELGLDTVEANHFLGYPAEVRTYSVAAAIIRLLEIRSLALLSNNPDKLSKLATDGATITRRIPLVVPPNNYNSRYLDTKRNKMGHLF